MLIAVLRNVQVRSVCPFSYSMQVLKGETADIMGELAVHTPLILLSLFNNNRTPTFHKLPLIEWL